MGDGTHLLAPGYGSNGPPENGSVETEEEEEVKVSTLELFSDLVIVVAIHIVAEPLEEEQSSHSNWLWYVVHVFMIYLLWQGEMLFMNAAAVFRMSHSPQHYVAVWIWMALVLLMTQAFGFGENRTAFVVYLVCRALEIARFSWQTHFNSPPHVSQDRVENMKSLVPIITGNYVVGELLPLLTSLALAESKRQPYLPAVLFYLVATQVLPVVISWWSDVQNIQRTVGNTLEASHLHERYELVTIIFIGEICFAAGQNGSDDGMVDKKHQLFVTFTALLLAFGAYLIMFRTPTTTYHHERMTRHAVMESRIYLGLFCVIPGIGAGFIHVKEPAEESSDSGCEQSASHLLSYSTGGFLLISGLLHSIDWWFPSASRSDSLHCGTGQPPPVGLLIRFVSAAGCLWPAFSFLPHPLGCVGHLPMAALLCPLITLGCASLEVWIAGASTQSQSQPSARWLAHVESFQ